MMFIETSLLDKETWSNVSQPFDFRFVSSFRWIVYKLSLKCIFLQLLRFAFHIARRFLTILSIVYIEFVFLLPLGEHTERKLIENVSQAQDLSVLVSNITIGRIVPELSLSP